MFMSNLSGKTARVTGASRGIGRARPRRRAGARTQAPEAQAVVGEIRAAGGRAVAPAADDTLHVDGGAKL
jgi:3-oxoacyl-[acyl-carrier protein] reductase